MVITDPEFNINDTGTVVAVTARFDGVQRRVPFDPDNEPDCLEFLQQVEDGDIQPIDVYD